VTSTATHTPQATIGAGAVGPATETPAEPPASLPDTGSYASRNASYLLLGGLLIVGGAALIGGFVSRRRRQSL
jgi:hypothetical protein